MSIEYFKQRADTAKTAAHRKYWLDRVEGAIQLQKQLEADRIAREKLAMREASLNNFDLLEAPAVSLDNKYPHGCFINWMRPNNWEPDTYIVLVRDKGQKKWRSVASTNITSETRKMILTPRMMRWGNDAEAYEIRVGAVKNGIGRKESKILTYPPGAGDSGAVEEQSTAPDEKTRFERIIEAVLNYKGKRTTRGKPYLWELRKQSDVEKITKNERDEAFMQVNQDSIKRARLKRKQRK